MSCPEGSGSDSLVLLVGLWLKKDESHFEKEGCVALLGSGIGYCFELHSHWCVQSCTRSPPAFRGSPSAAHPPRGAEPRAEGPSPALWALAGHFGLQVNGLLWIQVPSFGQVSLGTAKKGGIFFCLLGPSADMGVTGSTSANLGFGAGCSVLIFGRPC